jgi:hypothetical protein
VREGALGPPATTHFEPDLNTTDPGKSQKADDEVPSWEGVTTPQP